MIYVSTAFSNCPEKVIEEKLYPCPVSYEHVGAVLEKISKKEAEILTPRLVNVFILLSYEEATR